MTLDEAISRLTDRWIKDLARSILWAGSIPLFEGPLQARLHLVAALADQLTRQPDERWFDALPENGESTVFYEMSVLPLQQAEGCDAREVRARLWRHVEARRRFWLSALMVERRARNQAKEAVGQSAQTALETDLGLQHRLGEGYFRQDWRESPKRYFAFVEDVESILPGTIAYGLDDRPLDSAPGHVSLRHVRFSAILTDQFFPIAERIEPINPSRVTLEDRRRRGDQLRETLEDVPLPVLDLFIHPERREMSDVRPAFGNWWVLGLSFDQPSDGDIGVYVTDPEESERPTIRGVLSLLAPASAFWQARLRDIFSLVHIPDADFGTTDRNEGSPAPTPPLAPRMEEAAQAEETPTAEARAAFQRNTAQ